MDLERQEEKLAEEQDRGLYSFDGWDLSTELEELHDRVAGVEGECTDEDVKLSRLITEISDALVDMGVFPIWDIPQRPMLAQDVLTIVGLILDHLREEQSSGVGPWP
jgi:hypothetical protein